MEPSVDCKQIIELLDAYSDNELTVPERQSVERHLRSCAICTAQLQDIQRVVQDLAALPKLTLSRDIVGQIDFDALGEAKDEADLSGASLLDLDSFVQEGPVPGCARVIPILDAYHDQETSAQETSLVASHLHECGECRQRLADIGKLVAQLAAMPRVTMSRDLAETLPIGQEPAPVAAPVAPSAGAARQDSPNVVRFPGKAWMSVGAVAAAVVAVFAFNMNKPQPQVVADKTQPVVPAPVKKTPEAQPNPVVANNQAAQKAPASNTAVVAKKEETPAPGKKETVPQLAPQVIAGATKPAQAPEIKQNSQIRLAVNPEAEPVTLDNWEVAVVSDDDGSFADAMGIATDEDGVYDIKI